MNKKISQNFAFAIVFLLASGFAGLYFLSSYEFEYNEPVFSVKPLAERLAECLPMSDMESKEKCENLLKRINSFEECAEAGFSILKSNLPKCVLPDGRTFADDNNYSWKKVKKTIQTCEAESVFQAHSLFVAVRLKNGEEITAVEPRIDDVIKIAQEAEPQCGKIRMSTE